VDQKNIIIAALAVIVATLLFQVARSPRQLLCEPCPPAECEREASPETLTIPLSISYERYIINRTYWDGKRVTLYGTYEQGTEESLSGAIHRDYLADDDGRIIRLTTAPEENASLYQAVGVLRRIFEGMELEVLTIEPSERPTVNRTLP